MTEREEGLVIKIMESLKGVSYQEAINALDKARLEIDEYAVVTSEKKCQE